MKIKTKRSLVTFLGVLFMISACALSAVFTQKTTNAEDAYYSGSGYFEMVNEARLRRDADGFAFVAKMDADTYNDVKDSDDKNVYFMIIPAKYKVNVGEDYKRAVIRYQSGDNKGEVDEASSNCLYVPADSVYSETDGCYYWQAGIGNVKSNHRDFNFFAVAVIETKTGDYTYSYTYANIPDGSDAMPETNIYNVVTTALYSDVDYVSDISSVYGDWYGKSGFPVPVDSSDDYAILQDKLETYENYLTSLQYYVDGSVGDATDLGENVTSTYTVTIETNDSDYGSVNKTVVKRVPVGTSISVNDASVSIDGTNITATPKTATAKYTYALADTVWTVAEGDVPETVSGNVTLTANFKRTINSYTITFVNYDGTELFSDSVDYDELPVYGGATPQKADFLTKSFTHSGWDNAITTVTGDATYTATYNETTRTDFGKSTGTNLDLATDLAFWQYKNNSADDDVEITNASSVADGRGSGDTAYAFNTIKYSRPQNTGAYRALTGNMMYLAPEVIDLAVSLGYKWLTFYAYLPDIPSVGNNSATTFVAYNCKDDGSLHYYKSNSDPVVNLQQNSERWTYYSVDITDASAKYHSGAGIGFGMYGRELYLAKVEFIGADISEYAATYITESSTSGKSNDMVSENLIGKMFQTTDNANNSFSYTATGSDKETAIGGDDYITFSKSGYVNNYYGTNMNTVKISAEWIQAAKTLGYSVIGIYFKDVGGTGMSLRKFAADGTNVDFANRNSSTVTWHSTITAWGSLSIDISGFNVGDSLVVSIGNTTTVSITGVTFRTSTVTPSPALILKTA